MSDLAVYQREIGPEQAEVDQALAQLAALTIDSASTLDWAGDLLLKAKARGQALEAKRKEVTGPILTAKAAIDGLFKPLIGRYEQAEAILKQKIADWTGQVEAQRRAAMVASAVEYQAGGTPTLIIPEPAHATGITVRQVWDYEITDPGLVPRNLCSPDPKKIRDWLKQDSAEGPPVTLPGLRFFQRDQVIARTGK